MPLPYPTNPNLQAVPVYQPGRPIEEVARELGLAADSIIKVASNENPLGPSRLALAAMRKAVAQVNIYPDGNAFRTLARQPDGRCFELFRRVHVFFRK